MKIVSFIGICLLVLPVIIHGEIMGIDSPGTTDYSDWFGRIVKQQTLDDAIFCHAAVIDQESNRILFSTNFSTKSDLIDLSLEPFEKSNQVKTPQGLNLIKVIEPTENANEYLIASTVINQTDLVIVDIQTWDIRNSIRLPFSIQESCFFSEQLLFCLSVSDPTRVYKVDLDTGQFHFAEIDNIATQLIDVFYFESREELFCLSADGPGDLVKIDSNSLEVLDVITLPETISGRRFVWNNELTLVLGGFNQSNSDYYYIKSDVQPLSIQDYEKITENEMVVNFTSANQEYLISVVDENPPYVLKHEVETLALVDQMYFNNQMVGVSNCDFSGNFLVVFDTSEPLNIELLDVNQMTSCGFHKMDEQQKDLKNLVLNQNSNKLILSNSATETTLHELNNSDLEDHDVFTYSVFNGNTFQSLEIDDDNGCIFGIVDTNPNTLVKLDSFTNEIIDSLEITSTNPLIGISSFSNDSLLLSTHDTAIQVSKETFQIMNTVEYDLSDQPVMKIQPFSAAGCFFTVTNSAKCIKYDINSLQKISEVFLPSDGKDFSTIELAPNLAKGFFFFNSFPPEGGKMVSLDLEGMEVGQSIDLDPPFFSSNDMVYSIQNNCVYVGASYSVGGVQVIDAFNLEVSGTFGVRAMSNAISKGLYSELDNSLVWTNSIRTGFVTKVNLSRNGFCDGSKVVIFDSVIVSSLNFYSNQADGFLRLGILNGNRERIWQSDSIENTVTEGWVSIPINQGDPEYLTLEPGEYWLVFQVDSLENVPSVHPGEHGDGLRQAMPFGEFPDKLHFPEFTSDRYAVYAEWQYLYPTATPTATPSPSPSPTATLTPIPSATETPIPTATMSPTPPPTSTPTSTAVPDPGVKLQLESHWFQPGDHFSLTAEVNPDFNNLCDVNLWVVLDVYSSYWFGPVWSQVPDWYPLGELSSSHNELILQFQWPDVEGSAENLVFWGALLTAEDNQLVGFYDYVSFGYSG